MSNGLRLLLIAGLASLAWGNRAGADLVAPQASAVVSDASLVARDTASAATVSLDLAYESPAPATGASATLSDAKIRKLPAAPSSAALFLSGLLSMGAWHFCRSAKSAYANGLPDWYHAGAPDRIGHVVVFDLDFNAAPLCCFEQPVGERPFLYRIPREQTPRSDAQSFLIITAPRGPPSTS